MYIQQLYTNCLAEAAYYIESNGEAAIVDPMRETLPYLELAKSRGAKIKYVLETHFHADFISGHIDLAAATGAKIVYGPTAKAEFDILVANDEQILPLGNIKIKVLHTPGHTMESSCFLVIDEHGKEQAIFTGDTLFIGDVGRPDLAVKTDLTKEDLAKYLYNSLHKKVLTLNDNTIVYPGHGAGSQCGKNLSSEKKSTIGEQKKYNYALQAESQAAFVKAVTEGLVAPPQYFPKNAAINKSGYESLDKILTRSLQPLSHNQFEKEIELGAIILDTRPCKDFVNGFITGALSISLDGFFAVWIGTLIEDLNTPIILITNQGNEQDTILRLARVGYENVKGYLKGGFVEWQNKHEEITSKISCICPVTFNEVKNLKNVIDVRNEQEFELNHVKKAINIPLKELENSLNILQPSETYYIYCKSGYRSVIACSILHRHGFTNVINVNKGFEAINDVNATYSCSEKK